MDEDRKSWKGVPNLSTLWIKVVESKPIKRPSLSDDNKNLDSIIQHNNYTNIYLKSIGQKLQDIEDRITPPSTSIKKENESNTPLFIPHEIPPHLRSPLKRPMTKNQIIYLMK